MATRARLTDLWRLGPGEVIAVVGAGGKSTLLERLAREYEEEGARTVLATTTKMWPSRGVAANEGRTPSAGRPLVLDDTRDGLTSRVSEVLGAGGPSPVVGSGLTSDGKLDGVPPDWVPALRDLPGVEAVLIEGDGAAKRSLKYPAEWEPVLPLGVTLVVASAGLDALGAPLDDAHVHRARLAAEKMGLSPGSAIDAAGLIGILVAGYRPVTPRHARLLLFLNKRDLGPPGPEVAGAAEEAAARSEGGFEVWTGSALGSEATAPVARRQAPPVVVVPAAGLATRMGGPKVLAPLGAGTVVGRVVGAALRSAWCARAGAEVLVVSGEGAAEVEAALREEHGPGQARGWGLEEGPETRNRGKPWRVVHNPNPERGMASSLRIGVEAAGSPGDVLVLLGDQPMIEPESLDRLLAVWEANPRAAAAGAIGRTGVGPPVCLNCSLLPQVSGLQGDRGARDILDRYAARVVGLELSPAELLDVDTPADLEEARRRLALG